MYSIHSRTTEVCQNCVRTLDFGTSGTLIGSSSMNKQCSECNPPWPTNRSEAYRGKNQSGHQLRLRGGFLGLALPWILYPKGFRPDRILLTRFIRLASSVTTPPGRRVWVWIRLSRETVPSRGLREVPDNILNFSQDKVLLFGWLWITPSIRRIPVIWHHLVPDVYLHLFIFLGVNWQVSAKISILMHQPQLKYGCNLQARRKSAGKTGCLQLSFHPLIWTCQHDLEHGCPREWIQAGIKSPLTDDYSMDFDWMQWKVFGIKHSFLNRFLPYIIFAECQNCWTCKQPAIGVSIEWPQHFLLGAGVVDSESTVSCPPTEHLSSDAVVLVWYY